MLTVENLSGILLPLMISPGQIICISYICQSKSRDLLDNKIENYYYKLRITQ